MSSPLNYIIQNAELYNYRCNPNVLLTKSNFYSYIVEDKDKKPESQTNGTQQSIPKEWYPYVNSYYQYSEDYDAVNRVRHLLAEVHSESSLQSDTEKSQAKNPNHSAFKATTDAYSARSAMYKFLRKKPVCFIILGKPEIGEEHLGRFLAIHWNSIFIHPEDLIREEINAETRAGICIEYNLRAGRSISIDVIMRLLQKKINEEAVKHRGFVLCGFPLLTNTLFEQDPVSSEAAVFTVHDIFEEIFDAVVYDSKEAIKNVSRAGSVAGEGNEYDQRVFTHKSTVDDGAEIFNELERLDASVYENVSNTKPKDTPSIDFVSASRTFIIDPSESHISGEEKSGSSQGVCYESHLHDEHKNQMEFIFKLCAKHDCVLVYLKCENEEVVNIRKDNRLDATTFNHLNLQRDKYFQLDDSYGFINGRKFLKPQRDFPVNVSAQLEAYRFEAQTVIEKQILLQNPQYFVKLDGRSPPERVFHSLKMRLRILPLSQSVIPEILVEKDQYGDMESPKEMVEDFTNLTPEEWFEALHKKKIIGKMFKLSLSDWEFTCPVALVLGKPEYAVKFMNKIFFLSGEEECVKFRNNPRPYLLPPFPREKNQKILLVGPPFSGKTSICNMLANMLGVIKLDPETMQREFIARKRSEMINEIKAKSALDAKVIVEQQRLDNIKEYLAPIRRTIERYLTCIAYQSEETVQLQLTSLPRPRAVSKVHGPSDCMHLIPEMEQEILDFGLSVSNHDLLQEALTNDEVMEPYIPEDMLHWVEPSLSHPFVEEYLNKAVEEYSAIPDDEKEAELLLEYSECSSIAHLIQAAEEECEHGWIMDGFPPKVDLFQSLLDAGALGDQKYLVILILNDKSEDMEFLKNRNAGENELGNCKLFFIERDLEEIADNFRGKNLATRYSPSILSSQLTDASRKSLYNKSFDDFGNKLNVLKEYLDEQENAYQEFLVNNKTIEALVGEIVDYFDEKQFEKPRVLTEQDKLLEIEDYAPIGDEEADEEEEAHDDNYFQENRRLGVSNKFCPYALAESNVFRLGKEEFSARYNNETYLLSSAEALEAFVKNPKKMLRMFDNQPRKLPPAKICVVGSWKIGKTTVARCLADNFGLKYVNYDALIRWNFKEIDYLDYFHSDIPLEENSLLKILKDLWLNQSGFMLDGFPKRPSDVLLMIKHMLIPDLIIELHCEDYALRERLTQILMDEWQAEMNAMKMRQEEENRRVYEEWKVLREKRLQELLLWKRDERYAAKKRVSLEEPRASSSKSAAESPRVSRGGSPETQRISVPKEDSQVSKLEIIEEVDEGEVEETGSLVSYRSVEEQEDLHEIELILEEELPEPGFHDNWETEEIARERIEHDIDVYTTEEITFLVAIKEKCLEELINWETVDANNEERKVKLMCTQLAVKYKYKHPAIFERVYDVSIELAERLLEQGYYFLSKFGKTCPVQMYEANIYLQLFLPYENRFQLFPLIHKRYIYFVAGQENRVKFKENCLKYINQDYKDLPLIPIRIALTGPPKSGKSTITERLGYEYAFKLISIRVAVEHVLKFLSKSTLATKVEAQLRSGDNLSDELAIACVEALGFEDKALAVGFVMDGYPRGVTQVKLLAKYNLLPHLILDLNTDLEYIFTYMDVYPKTHRPEYSKKFIEHRYNKWRECQGAIRKWIDREYQNIAVIKIDPSKWKFWKTSEKLLLAVIYEIKFYYTNKDEVKPLRIANLLVSPHEFLQRKSRFKSFCPCCLYEENALSHGGNPPDRTNLFQYKDFFYWLCKTHVGNFLANPDIYIDNIPHSLPITLPEIITLCAYPDEPYENGVCVVCIEKGKPERVFNQGLIDYAVKYGDTIYLFDTRECLDEFFVQPGKFYSVCINFRGKNLPNLEMTELPTLGLLEQFDAKQVVKAVFEVSTKRPFIIGLDVQTSALIMMGLCLKIRNPATQAKYVEVFKEAVENIYQEKCLLKKSLVTLKSTINPYLHYQEPLPPVTLETCKRLLNTIEEGSGDDGSETLAGSRSSTTDAYPSLSDSTIGSVIANTLDEILENATR